MLNDFLWVSGGDVLNKHAQRMLELLDGVTANAKFEQCFVNCRHIVRAFGLIHPALEQSTTHVVSFLCFLLLLDDDDDGDDDDDLM